MIKITQTKVNVLLLFSIIMLSLQTISWHHELKQLHAKSNLVITPLYLYKWQNTY